jgi:hypothetical protein
MSIGSVIATLLWVPFLGFAFLAIRRLWHGETSLPRRAPSWWVWGEGLWRGWIRTQPVTLIAGVALGTVAFLGFGLAAFSDRRVLAAIFAVAALVAASVFVLAGAFALLIALFNWPKFLVPPHLRRESGAIR